MSKVVVKLEMRRRPDVEEPRADALAAFLRRADSLPERWWRKADGPEFVEDGALELQVNLGSRLPSNATGYVAYVLRDFDYLGDSAVSDDRCILEFIVGDRSYRDLARVGFRAYVEAFRPYRAQLTLDEDLALDDWEQAIARRTVSGRDEDGRDGIARIWPVAYYDAELCRRAFGLQPGTIVERLKQAGHTAVCLLDGVLISASAELLDSGGVRSLSSAMMSAVIA